VVDSHSSSRRVLGAFPLAMMGIAAILALRNLSITAVYGFSAVTFYVCAALVFFLPSALVCAELATTWPKAGGLYAWVKLAFGPRIGFVAIWLEWINTVIAFPMMIAFIIFTIIYPFCNVLGRNAYFEFSVFLVILWSLTILNFSDIKVSSRFSSICVIGGTLFPVVLLIALAAFWLFSGHPSQIHFSFHSLVPSFQLSSLAFLVVVINSFSGVQIVAFHAMETINPEKTYKRAIFAIVLVLLATVVLGTLAIAIVMPHNSADLLGGFMNAYSAFLKTFHLGWFMWVIAVLVTFGILSEINSWFIGPSKGLLAAAESGALPKILAMKNEKGMPIAILILQAIVSSLLGLAYILMPSVNSAYWLLSDLTAEFTLMMWVLVFISAIVLRYRFADVKRVFSVPGGKFGMIIIAGAGAITCFSIFIIGFIPPSIVIKQHDLLSYESFLIGGIILFLITPFLLSRKKKS